MSTFTDHVRDAEERAALERGAAHRRLSDKAHTKTYDGLVDVLGPRATTLVLSDWADLSGNQWDASTVYSVLVTNPGKGTVRAVVSWGWSRHSPTFVTFTEPKRRSWLTRWQYVEPYVELSALSAAARLEG